MIIKRLLARMAAILLVSVGSQASAERYANPPSGVPEGVFTDLSTSQVQGKITNFCMDRGYPVVSDAGSATCELPMSKFGSAILSALIAPRYSTPLKNYVQFSIAEAGDTVRVQARGWLETQTAFGQLQRTPQVDDNFFNGAIGLLMAMGAELPVGTTFQTKPYLGLSGYSFVRTQIEGKTITVVSADKLTPGSPLQRAGVIDGDLLIKIDDKELSNEKTFDRVVSNLKIGTKSTLKIQRKLPPAYGIDGFISNSEDQKFEQKEIQFKVQIRKTITKIGEKYQYDIP